MTTGKSLPTAHLPVSLPHPPYCRLALPRSCRPRISIARRPPRAPAIETSTPCAPSGRVPVGRTGCRQFDRHLEIPASPVPRRRRDAEPSTTTSLVAIDQDPRDAPDHLYSWFPHLVAGRARPPNRRFFIWPPVPLPRPLLPRSLANVVVHNRQLYDSRSTLAANMSSSSPEPAAANGFSPSPDRDGDITADGHQSESDLSEVNDTVIAHPLRPASAVGHDSPAEENVYAEEQDAIESSDSDNDHVSEDADFDMEESPAPSQSDAAQDDRSTSNDSRPTAKRKVANEEEDFINANPELYGLRRSVCREKFSLP
jgi:hypothetical protein